MAVTPSRSQNMQHHDESFSLVVSLAKMAVGLFHRLPCTLATPQLQPDDRLYLMQMQIAYSLC